MHSFWEWIRAIHWKQLFFMWVSPPMKAQIKKNKIPDCWLILQFKQLEIYTIIKCFFLIFCTPNLVPCGLIYTRVEWSHLQQNSMGTMLEHVQHCVVLSILKKITYSRSLGGSIVGESPRRQAVLLDLRQAVSSTLLCSSSHCLSDHRYHCHCRRNFQRKKGRCVKKAVVFFTAVQEAN